MEQDTWDKIGRVTEPGRYKCFFGYLTVTPDDLDVLPESDTTNRSARRFSAPLRALQYTGPPVQALRGLPSSSM
jgi:hypothetical protein